MKIIAVKTFIVPSRVSHTEWCKGKAWLLVKLETDAGIDGWGEAYVPHDCERSVATMVQELARYVEGIDPFQIKYFTTMAYECFSEMQGGIHFSSAVSGIEIAMWDIVGKALETPVHKLLGGPCRHRIAVYANCWSHEQRSADQIADYAMRHVERGFKAVKIYPFLYSDSVNDGIERLSAVRAALGPDISVLVDAWRVAGQGDLTVITEALRDNAVEWFEDPVAPENLDVLADIRRSSGLPIVTGETFYSKREFCNLLEKRAADILNPDITCCGILAIKEIAAMAEPYLARVAVHNYNTMTVGLAASMQVAAVIPNFVTVEHFPRFEAGSNRFSCFPCEIDEDGCMPLSKEPGLGVTVDEALLESFEYEPSPLRQW